MNEEKKVTEMVDEALESVTGGEGMVKTSMKCLSCGNTDTIEAEETLSTCECPNCHGIMIAIGVTQ